MMQIKNTNTSKLWLFTILSVALLFALSYGFNFGVSNHNTYLLHALKLYKPGILASDWLASETTSYHPIFTKLSYYLLVFDSSGWIFGWACVIFITLIAITFWLLITTLVKNKIESFAVFLFLIGINLITRTFSVTHSYLVANIFQPSLVAGLGFLLACWLFVRGQFIWSGIFLGLFMIFHANYLILSFPVFGLAHLFLGKKQLISRCFKQFIPVSLGTITILPLLLDTLKDPLSAEGKQIFQWIVAPIHYVPLRFIEQFIPFLGWQLLAIAFGWRWFMSSEITRRFSFLLLSIVILLWASTILTTVVFIPTISQLYFWRLAPFSDMFCQIIIGVCLFHYLAINTASQNSPLFVNKISQVFAAIGLVLLLGYFWFLTKLTMIIALIIIITVIAKRRFNILVVSNKFFIFGIASLIFASALLLQIRDGRYGNSSLLVGFPIDEQELYQWVRDNSDINSIFLVSPKLINFRFNAQRAIIVDEKSTPILGSDLVEWYQRMEVVSGIKDFSHIDQAAEGYKKLDLQYAASIAEQYPFDYFVVETDHQAIIPTGPVYANKRYQVYAWKNNNKF